MTRSAQSDATNGSSPVWDLVPCVTIFVSDLHLSHTAPLARSNEPSWYDAMARQLNWLRKLQDQLKAPILCAGDVFDRWNVPPELISFALVHLPQMFAIPGQHDLPHHNHEQMHRSAYWTLVEAGKLIHVGPGAPTVRRDLNLAIHGYPWEVPLEPRKLVKDLFNVAIVHRYVWKRGYSYPHAKRTDHVNQVRQFVRGFDAVAFGDNHQGFMRGNLINCGTFFRRHQDERDYRPQIGVLHEDGQLLPLEVPCHLDVFLDAPKEKQKETMLKSDGLIRSLREIQEHRHDLPRAARQYMKSRRVSKKVVQKVMELIDGQTE